MYVNVKCKMYVGYEVLELLFYLEAEKVVDHV